MRAALLSIGDELLLGEKPETNSAAIAQLLLQHGIDTTQRQCVGDDRRAIHAALAALAAEAELVVATGGLGPTADDLTREALGDLISPGESLEIDTASAAAITARFAARGRVLQEMELRQARCPRGSRCLSNGVGVAPGIAARHGKTQIICLPGPPNEALPMLAAELSSLTHERGEQTSPSTIRCGIVQSCGLGETESARRLGELMRRDANPHVGTTASGAMVQARIRWRGQQATPEAIGSLQERIMALWHPWSYSPGDDPLSAVVGQMLRRRGESLAVAESCTGGLLGGECTHIPGSSDWFRGGVIAYSNQVKVDMLGVDPMSLLQHGAVSAQTARAMALGVLSRFSADWAIAITGVAGPGGGTAEKPSGTVLVSVAGRAQVGTTRRFLIPGTRSGIRERSVRLALQALRFELLGCADQPLLHQVAHSVQSGERSAK